MMGTGEAEGEDRAQKAADMAISNPLLDDVSMKGARGVLINITGGPDLGLFEVEAAANRIRAEVDPAANIIFGNTILENMEGRIRVSVVATGIEAAEMRVGKTIEPFSPRLKARPVDMLKAAAAQVAQQHKPAMQPQMQPMAQPIAQPMTPAPSPVHRRIEDLEAGLNIPHTPTEAMILGDTELPPPDLPAFEPEPAPRPMHEEIVPVRQPEPERKGWGLFRKKVKEEPRVEPAPRAAAQQASRPPVQPRAMAQAEPLRPQTPAQGQRDASDLFADQKRDDQFEIPAFLRRQTN